MQKNTLFQSVKVSVKNEAGGVAYKNSTENELARVVCTSFFGKTYYTEGKDQLDQLKLLAEKCSTTFVAACAVYARNKGLMKDTPTALLLTLRSRDQVLFKQIFNSVVTDARILRGLVQMIRSGEFGSKNLGSCTRKLVNNWLNSKTPVSVWNQSIGNSPSMRDVMRLSRPSPKGDAEREAVYKLIVMDEQTEGLPQVIKDYYAFKDDISLPLPKVNFQRLTALELKDEHWMQLGLNMTWNQLRQNINSLEKHNVLKDTKVVTKLAALISDHDAVRKANVFPYQVYTSCLNVTNIRMKNALQTALDHSVENVPVLPDNTVVAIDVSGSMGSPVNGQNVNGGLTCAQVAGLMAVAIYKKNPNTRVITFDTQAREYTASINPHDSVMTNLTKIKFNGGGTACSSAVKYIVDNGIPCDLLVMISDNESWSDYTSTYRTAMKQSWDRIKAKHKEAKLVLMDLTPSSTQQMPESKDTLFLAGFSDNLFNVISNWLEGDRDFVAEILNNFKPENLV